MALSKSNSARASKSAAASSAARVAAKPATLREDARAFKKEMILTAAIDIFYEDGYQAATVEDVAATLSVTKAAVYYYFKSKETLLQAIIERCSDLTLVAIERGIATGDTPVKKLALASFCFASMVLENQKMIALYFREERYFSPALSQRVAMIEKSVTAKISKVIEAGIRRGDFRQSDPQRLALSITGMISMAFYWNAEHSRLPSDELARALAVDAVQLAGCAGEIALEKWLSDLHA